MARPPLTDFNPTKNDSANFGANTRRMYQLLPDFIDDIENDGMHQRGAKLHGGIVGELEDGHFNNSDNDNNLIVTNSDSSGLISIPGYNDRGAVFETKIGYTNVGTSISTHFMDSRKVGEGQVPLSLSTDGGYRAINLGTQTLEYPTISESLELTMYLAVRVPLGASMELDIRDGDNSIERTGFVIQNSGDANQEMLVGHFNTRAEFNTSVSNSAGGGIYFIKIHIPTRETNRRDFEMSLAKWSDADLRVPFAPQNNFNNLNITPNFPSTGTAATNERLISISGLTDGAQLFYAKVISGSILNAF